MLDESPPTVDRRAACSRFQFPVNYFDSKLIESLELVWGAVDGGRTIVTLNQLGVNRITFRRSPLALAANKGWVFRLLIVGPSLSSASGSPSTLVDDTDTSALLLGTGGDTISCVGLRDRST